MNKLLTAIMILSCLTTFGQDCTTAEDCLNKGKATGFESEAFKFYEKALKLAKKENYNPSQIYLHRGIKYYNLYTADMKNAGKDFKAAIEADEKNMWAYAWLANVYAYGDKDYKQAIDFLTKTLAKFPNEIKLLRERANIHKANGYQPLALTDYEMAYNLIIDDPAMTDEWTAGEIIRWYAELYMKSKGLIFADETALKILEDGSKIAPNSAGVLGDLALAYFDNNQDAKAYEYGARAHAIDTKTVGSLFVAMKKLESQEYWGAATLMWDVDRNLMHPHPLAYFYFANAQWAYCYNVAKNQWVNNKEIIRNRLQLTVQHGSGTSYDWYAKEATKMLATIDN